MKKIIFIILSVTLLIFAAGCEKTKEKTQDTYIDYPEQITDISETEISKDITDIDTLDEELDMSDLDSLDEDLDALDW